jgi:toxin CcdB
MTQFDVFANPINRARHAYPFLVILQSDVAQSGRERSVAPAAPRVSFPPIPGRLTPIVTINRDDFVLLVPSLTAIPVQSLGTAVASLVDRREDILAAIDHLLSGV